MPYIRIETSDLTVSQKRRIAQKLSSQIADIAVTPLSHVSIFFYPLSPGQLSTGGILRSEAHGPAADYIFVKIELLEGRSQEQKQSLSRLCKDVLSEIKGVSEDHIEVIFFDLVHNINII